MKFTYFTFLLFFTFIFKFNRIIISNLEKAEEHHNGQINSTDKGIKI